jgi:hypothetical protein
MWPAGRPRGIFSGNGLSISVAIPRGSIFGALQPEKVVLIRTTRNASCKPFATPHKALIYFAKLPALARLAEL